MLSSTWNTHTHTRSCPGDKILSQGQNSFVPGTKSCPRDKTVLSLCVRDKIILSRRFILRARRNGTATVLADTLGFFLIERDWPSRRGSSRHLQTNNLNHLDFSKKRNENLSDFIQEWFFTTSLNGFIFTQSFSHKKKWEARNTRQTWFFTTWLNEFIFNWSFSHTNKNGKRETYGRRGSSWRNWLGYPAHTRLISPSVHLSVCLSVCLFIRLLWKHLEFSRRN